MPGEKRSEVDFGELTKKKRFTYAVAHTPRTWAMSNQYVSLNQEQRKQLEQDGTYTTNTGVVIEL